MRLGADPEVFLYDNVKARFVSAIGKIGGSKLEPLQIPSLPKGFTLQEDNVALEFGIPPASSQAMFVKNIQAVMNSGLSKVDGLDFSNLSAAFFPKEELDHPLAWRFGCEPDFNAWTGKENEKPEAPDPTFRTAGGHVHLETQLNPDKMGQALDLFLGVPSLFADREGQERRNLYGNAGAIRYKPYGLEYRVLSNFWIFNPKLIRWVWQQAHLAEKFVLSGEDVPTGVEYCINNSELNLAAYFVKEYSLNVPQR